MKSEIGHKLQNILSHMWIPGISRFTNFEISISDDKTHYTVKIYNARLSGPDVDTSMKWFLDFLNAQEGLFKLNPDTKYYKILSIRGSDPRYDIQFNFEA